MNTKPNKSGSEFKSGEEAFEYLVQHRLDEKRRARWAEELGPVPKESTQPKNKRLTRTFILRISAAASFLVLVAGYLFFFQKAKPLNQYAEMLLAETEINIQYASGSRGEDITNQAMEIKRLKSELTSVLLDEDYNQALGYFKQLEKIVNLTNEDKYYYAVSILKTKGEDYQKAIRMLSDVIQSGDTDFKDALLLRGLAYGMTNNAVLMKNDLKNVESASDKTNKMIKNLITKY